MTVMKAMSGTVLVVDDEDIVREVVCTYLEREGYSTLQASAGRAALALIESEQPDLVVLDLSLRESAVILGIGVLLGLVGSWFAAARHMRRIEPR